MKAYLFVYIILLSFFISCKKQGLTSETQDGANTFSCMIGDILFKPCDTPGGFFADAKKGLGATVGDRTFGGRSAYISAQCWNDHPNRHVYIELYNFTGPNEYLLPDSVNRAVYTEEESLPGSSYSTAYGGSGKVIITKDDKINFILSGTFEFTAPEQNDREKFIKVTSGRFDIKYQ